MNVQLSVDETYADITPVRQPGALSAYLSITRVRRLPATGRPPGGLLQAEAAAPCCGCCLARQDGGHSCGPVPAGAAGTFGCPPLPPRPCPSLLIGLQQPVQLLHRALYARARAQPPAGIRRRRGECLRRGAGQPAAPAMGAAPALLLLPPLLLSGPLLLPLLCRRRCRRLHPGGRSDELETPRAGQPPRAAPAPTVSG